MSVSKTLRFNDSLIDRIDFITPLLKKDLNYEHTYQIFEAILEVGLDTLEKQGIIEIKKEDAGASLKEEDSSPADFRLSEEEFFLILKESDQGILKTLYEKADIQALLTLSNYLNSIDLNDDLNPADKEIEKLMFIDKYGRCLAYLYYIYHENQLSTFNYKSLLPPELYQTHPLLLTLQKTAYISLHQQQQTLIRKLLHDYPTFDKSL
jgi:hypothetical protein